MIFLPIFVAGGLLYAGGKVIQQLRADGRFAQRKGHRRPQLATGTLVETPLSPARQKANQTLAMSSVSLSLATAGALLHLPVLGLTSLPIMLYVFVPTFKDAWRKLNQDKQIDNHVLDAVRITVCVAAGYTFIAALNAVLHALSQHLFVRNEEKFQRTLQNSFGKRQIDICVYHDGVELQTPAEQIDIGSVIVVSVGDTLPGEGIVLHGEGWVDQRLAKGDLKAIKKSRGDRVFTASILRQGQLYIQLETLPSTRLTASVHHALAQTTTEKSLMQRIGEHNGERTAPWMLAAFVLILPIIGVNRAAAFLTTTFGAQLRNLGPYTVRQFIGFAAQQGIVITQPNTLERAELINTIIFDSRVLIDPVVRTQVAETLQALRQRRWLIPALSPQRFAIHVLVKSDEEELGRALVAELGLDDYFNESASAVRASLIERLQKSGRIVCYIGKGEGDAAEMRTALLAISHRNLEAVDTTPAQIMLIDNDLRQLPRVFDLARAYAAKQNFNLATPIGCDLIDISTTLFLKFGLVYSVLLTYTGLLVSAANARLPIPEDSIGLKQEAPEPTEQFLLS
ncbi:MAG: hypothetical protein ACRD9S_25435 [Pyrinomonadaceae bacterium]